MLKNNQKREQYIRDEKNWDILEYDVIQSLCADKQSDEELHGGICTGIPEIRLKRLRGTTVFKIEALSMPMHLTDKPHYVEIGCKVFKENGQLSCIYDLSFNQLVAYLREHKV